MKKRSTAAFSLVELTLAIGIAALCLIAVFGLVPVGVQTNRNATSQTAATNILSSVASDLRASPPNQQSSSIYGISRSKNTWTTVCFDGKGGWTKLTGPNRYPACLADSVYRLYVQIDNTTTSPVYPPVAHVYLRVTWPALASSSATASGSVETVTAYFIK